jgi:uncharacterized membrane protein
MNQQIIALIGQICVSVVSLVIFIVALAVALRLGNENMLLMLIGASIAMAQTVVSYWLGSSSSSAKKDDVIASQQATNANQEPKP